MRLPVSQLDSSHRSVFVHRDATSCTSRLDLAASTLQIPGRDMRPLLSRSPLGRPQLCAGHCQRFQGVLGRRQDWDRRIVDKFPGTSQT